MPGEMRNKARNHVKAAKYLLSKGDESSLRYACLELRFAIEYLVYSLLSSYKDEVDEGVARKWTPRQVISEILAIDPCGDSSSKLSYGVETELGKQSDELSCLGEDVRFKMRWANVNHNALGNFLHAPTLEQIEKGKVPTVETLTNKASEAIDGLDKVLSSSVFGTTLGVFYSVACDCGKAIKRRKGSFEKEDGIKCPHCQALWDIISEDQAGNVTFLMRKIPYNCPVCGEENLLPSHVIKEGAVVTCNSGHDSQIVLALQPTTIEQSKD